VRVFVLGTGRCGTVTFAKACSHFTNFTSGHETRVRKAGLVRLAYPDDHIEVDPRLVYFLPWLDWLYPHAVYAHLYRDVSEVAQSMFNRWMQGTGRSSSLLDGLYFWRGGCKLKVCLAHAQMIDATIRAFLSRRDVVKILLKEPEVGFQAFMDRIGAVGDRVAALAEWKVHYNSSKK
jgi:hypothetical protein